MNALISYRFILILLFVVPVPLPGISQNAPALNSPSNVQSTTNTGKIAFVSIQQVVANCDEGKDESAKFRQWAEKRQAELQGLQKDIDTLKNRLDVQGSKLTEEARNDLVDSIDAKEASLQRSQQDSQKEADKRQQRATDSIYKKVMPLIEKLARERFGFRLFCGSKSGCLYQALTGSHR